MMGGFRSPRDASKQRQLNRSGFTIIEAMIVLAVTGVLFVSAVSAVSGRQRKVEFNQAINAIKGQIEHVIGEVQSGYFPSNDFNCLVSGSPPSATLTFEPAATEEQGTRKPCVFLGKAIQFGTGIGSDPERYAVYTIAGANNATSLANSSPTVVNLDSITETKMLQHGMTTRWISGNLGAIAFTTYFADSGTSVYGSRSIQVIPVLGTSLSSDGVEEIRTNLASSPRNPDDGVQVCFQSGGTDQSGLITIGGGGGMNSVKLEIKNGPDCA